MSSPALLELVWEPCGQASGDGHAASLAWAHRKLHTAVHWNDRAYVYGGISVENGNLLDSLFTLNLRDGQRIDTPATTRTTTPTPGPRHSHVAAVIDGNMYVHGGVASSGRVCQDLHCLKLATGKWTRIQVRGGQEPPRRYGHSVIVHNRSLVIFGGSDGVEVFSTVWIYSLDSNTWELVRYHDNDWVPAPRLYHCSVSLSGSFFVQGGTPKVALDGHVSLLSDCQEFQLESREWRPVENRGRAPLCCGHSAVIYQDMMIVVGGHWGEMAEPNALYRFNFVTGEWSIVRTRQIVANDVFTRRFQASLQVNSTLFVFGGESANPRETYAPASRCLKLNLSTLRGSSRPPTGVFDSVFQPEDSETLPPTSIRPSNPIAVNSLRNQPSPPYRSPSVSMSYHSNGSTTTPPPGIGHPYVVHGRSISGSSSSSVDNMRTVSSDFEAIMSSLRIKCDTGDEIRLLSLPRNTTYDRVLTTMCKEIGLRQDTLSLHYLDEEGDRIVVRSQADLDEAIMNAEHTSCSTTSISFSDDGSGITGPGENASSSTNRTIALKFFLTNRNGGPLDRQPVSRHNSISHGSSKTHLLPSSQTTTRTASAGSLAFPSPLLVGPSSPFLRRAKKYATTAIRGNSDHLSLLGRKPVFQDLSVIKDGPLIGRGAHSSVLLGLDPLTGHFLAIKDIWSPHGLSSRLAAVLREQSSQFMDIEHHDHLVQYYGFLIDGERIRLFVEYISGGSIADLLSKFGTMSEAVAKMYTRQILMGLDELHSRNIAHGALKSSNALLDSNGAIKLSDFFFSQQGVDFVTESALELQVRCKEDIYRVGCIMMEMLSGSIVPLPNSGINMHGAAGLNGNITAVRDAPLIPESVSPDASDFILQCFNKDPSARPSATNLLQHPFLLVRSRSRSLVKPTRSFTSSSNSSS